VGWVRDEPVFWNGPARFPEDFYRSNYTPADFYIDEPAIRFGWDGGIPGQLPGPEAFANAIQMRLEGLQRPDRRMMGMEGVHHSGAMFPVLDPCPSWETFLWTAAYQMAGGASALVFEGRYVRRGYGWAPELLLGEGLEGLDDRQQFDYFNSFLRGAARQWDREWGVSVYPEGDPDLMVPAFIRAYDQGARNFWFWGGPGLEYTQRVRVLRGLKAHIEAHPSLLRAGSATLWLRRPSCFRRVLSRTRTESSACRARHARPPAEVMPTSPRPPRSTGSF
jgi:hypothetical protein